MTDDFKKRAREKAEMYPYGEMSREDCILLYVEGAEWALAEIQSYYPKVPTQPYEKEMAQEIARLKAELEERCIATPAMNVLHSLQVENDEFKAENDKLKAESFKAFILKWLAFEQSLIDRDGPYVLPIIPNLMNEARQLLEGEK